MALVAVFTLVMTIHKNGSSMTAAETSKSSCASHRPGELWGRSVAAVSDISFSVVVNPMFAAPERQCRQRQNKQQLQPGHRAGNAHVHESESVVIKEKSVEVGRSLGPALRHDVWCDEDLR